MVGPGTGIAPFRAFLHERMVTQALNSPHGAALDPGVADVLAKTNQAVTTLETYRTRLEQVLTRLTALEFQNAVMLDDVLVTLQRAELTTRMAEEIERACVELGEEGRLIRMQLEELVADVPDEKAALVYDYHAEGGPERTGEGLDALAALDHTSYSLVLSDMRSGLWLFKVDGFNGWNGHDHGMPNISSVQDWDNGPEGAPKGGKPVT